MPIAILGLPVSLWSLFVWLAAIAITIRLYWKKTRYILERHDIVFLVPAGIVALILLAYFSSIPWHYHQDEFITAYTSWTLPSITKIDWFAAYPDVWVSQFPVLFHILQKPFFSLFGPSVWAVRISVWPYYLGILFFLYLLAKRIRPGSEKIVSLLFIFFAPMLYLSSMGLHFISSTFFFIASLYFLLFYNAVLLGLFTALSYLTYTSSYVTGPIVLLSALYLRRKLLPVVVVVLVILLPFLVYAAFVNNFFLQRIDQVNAISGSWSDIPQKMKSGASLVSLIASQITTALRSLIQPGIAGIGGYNFGKLALFEPLGFLLFLMGFPIVVKRSFVIVFAMFFTFLTNFILTTQPPAFHRISLLYPLFALSMGVVLYRQKRAVVILVVSLFALSNLNHVRTMIDNDKTLYPQNSRVIAQYLLKNVPRGSPVSIAAFAGFHLPQELVFRTNNGYRFVSDYHGETLILLNATQDTLSQLSKEYPNHRIITELENISLGDLTLFTPF